MRGQRRLPVLADLMLTVATAGTILAVTAAWQGFSRSPDYLRSLAGIVAVVCAIGWLARTVRVPAALTPLVQAAVGLGALSWAITGTPLPGAELGTHLQHSLDAAGTYASPVPETAAISIHPLLIVIGLGFALIVDAVATTLNRVPAAGIVLLCGYSVPLSLLDDGLHWSLFVLAAAGFLLMLYLQEQSLATRWGRSLTERSERVSGTVLRFTALFISAVTVAIAVVVPPVIPTLDLHWFGLGPGDGGHGDISVHNPIVDLRRDLRRGADVPLITVHTKDPDPSYLRISVLNRFSSSEWSSGDREVPPEQRARGEMPALRGVSSSLGRVSYRYQIDIEKAFDSTWLPTQEQISEIDALGDWRYDVDTMDFIASDDETNAAGAHYYLTSVDLDYDPDRLRAAGDARGRVPEENLALPTTLPPTVATLAEQVTSAAPSLAEKAAALQKWFRSDGGFTYSLRRAKSDNGVQSLVDFLDPKGRVGYCEQFAASMAVMARTLGIPSRVAVGFLTPERVSANTYVYSSHDLHAWPELFFPGSGWVRFDPTPSARVPQVPGYTRMPVQVNTPGQPTSRPEGQPSTAPPSRRPLPEATDRTRPEHQDRADTGAHASDDAGVVPGWLIGLVIVLALLALALAPRLLRRRAHSRRLRAGPEEALAEVVATLVDLGHPSPGARSPRQIEAWVTSRFGAPDLPRNDVVPRQGADLCPTGVTAMHRLALEVERLRYAPEHRDEGGRFDEEVRLVTSALRAGVTRRAERRSVWWPRSLFAGRPRGRGGSAERPTGPQRPEGAEGREDLDDLDDLKDLESV